MNKLNYHWIIQSMTMYGTNYTGITADEWLAVESAKYIERMPVYNKLEGCRVFVSRDFKRAIMLNDQVVCGMRICQECLNDVIHLSGPDCFNCQSIKERVTSFAGMGK